MVAVSEGSVRVWCVASTGVTDVMGAMDPEVAKAFSLVKAG